MSLPLPVLAGGPMRRGVICRVIRRNAYAVKMDHYPNVAEVHCRNTRVENREAFDRRCKALNPYDTEGTPPIEVCIHLGPYCLKNRAFVNCILEHPCPEGLSTADGDSDWSENDSDDGASDDGGAWAECGSQGSVLGGKQRCSDEGSEPPALKQQKLDP